MQDFLIRLERMVQNIFPDVCAALGAEGTTALIREALERAAGADITLEDDVALFVNLVFGLGRLFDEEPKFAIIQSVLRDRQLAASVRMQVIYDLLGSGVIPLDSQGAVHA